MTLFPWDRGLNLCGEIRDSICHSDSRSDVTHCDDGSYRFSHEKWKEAAFRVQISDSCILSDPLLLPPLNRDLPTEDALLPFVDLMSNDDDDHLLASANQLLAHSQFSTDVDDFLAMLHQAVRRRLVNVDVDTGVGVLFSGGVDCSLLAAVVNALLSDDVAVDLLNVAFQPIKKITQETCKKNRKKETSKNEGRSNDYDVPDRRTGLNAWRELKMINPRRNWRFVAIDVPFDELTRLKKERVSKLIHPLRTILDDSIGCATWFAARGRGNIVRDDVDCGVSEAFQSTARVLFLGSGADEQLGG